MQKLSNSKVFKIFVLIAIVGSSALLAFENPLLR